MIGDPDTVAVVGDLHGNSGWSRRAVQYARDLDADVIVQVGDFGIWPGWQTPGTGAWMFLDGLQRKLEDLDLTLLFLDGNHECHLFLTQLVEKYGNHKAIPLPNFDRISYLPRGLHWQWFDRTFMSLGGAVSVDKHLREFAISWWPEEILSDSDVLWASREPVDVVLAHDCPLGVSIPGIHPPLSSDAPLEFPLQALMDAEQHRQQVRDVWIATHPQLWIHGHYHVCYESGVRHPDSGEWTRFVGLDRDHSDLDSNLMILQRSDFT